jgi:hypothetical protein
MTKRVAICFSGQVRTGEQPSLIDNLNTNLINPLKENGYEVFYFGCAEREYHSFNWSDFKVVKDDNYWKDKIEKYDTRLGEGLKYGSYGVLNQWKKIQTVGRLKYKFETEKGFIFNMVIRIRPDIVFGNKLDCSSLDLSKFNIPNHDNWGGYNDRICISNSSNMDFYMIDFMYMLDSYFDVNKIVFHPETLLKHHIDNAKHKVHRPNFHVLFEREEGTDYKNITFD